MPKLKLKKAMPTNTPESSGKSKFNQITNKEDHSSEAVQEKPKTLWDIVDHEQDFHMLYSGVEDERNFDILYDMGIRNFLVSYQYVQNKHMNVDKFSGLGIKFFVDSGAYTYRNDSKYAEFTIEDWEKQIDRYLKWAKKHKDIIFAIANLDIEGHVDPEIVQQWNEKYFEPFMLETGIPVCFIYHEGQTARTWEQYAQRYPYIGMPWEFDSDDGERICRDRLRITEKYNTVVHGMAMTKTSLLTSLPFYTVDSTTWMVGLQYGEVNYWTGKKMTRLKKDKWKGNMLPKLVSLGFDEQKLLDEDSTEMIRVNVHAFIEAEEYIQKQCRARMYWLRPKGEKRTEADLDSIEYPTPEWLDNPEEQDATWEHYAELFNVSKEDRVQALNCVIDMTCFMNWDNPDYAEFINRVYTPEVIKEIHDLYINRIVQSDEERVTDLIQFYKENLLGENDKLLLLGTNFDRVVKERETYITDDEYDTEDVSEMEVLNVLSKYLPESTDGEAPEIDSLDDEIFAEEGITPIRDEHGHFLKGQRQVLKPKKMYSKKFPKLACDTCYAAQKCPEYKAGFACAYNKIFDKFDTRDMGDIIQAMQGIVDFSLGRLQRTMMFEMLEGGLPDPNVSAMMDQSMRYLGQLKAMYENGSTEVLRQTKILRSDGTQEMTTQVTNPQRGGILEKIFGDLGKSDEDKKEDIVDADI
jgi:hypothetical protein